MEKFKITKEVKPSPENRIIVARHFEDVDDVSDGLDTSLNYNSVNFEETLSKVSNEIITDTVEKGYNRILILSSPRQRAVQTAEQIKLKIQETDTGLKVHTKTEDKFAELDHGEIVVPEDYVPGRRIEFLKDAWRVFWFETFTSEGEYNNTSYKFGDPVVLRDGVIKYPELTGKFTTFGENYKTLSLRYYEALLEYLKNRHGLSEAQTNLVLVAHSATLSIFTELQDIARDVINGQIELPEGNLMKICWQRYLGRTSKEVDDIKFATTRIFELSDFSDEVIALLEREVLYLKSKE